MKKSNDLSLIIIFAIAILAMPWWMAPLGAGYPDLLQKFAIFGVFAIGFNILFGLTGYLSFGHAAFLGIGCLLYTSPSPRDRTRSRMPSSA